MFTTERDKLLLFTRNTHSDYEEARSFRKHDKRDCR